MTGRGQIVFMVLLVVCVFGGACPADPKDQIRTISDVLGHGPGRVNHPVNIVPSANITIPQTWPLDAKGSITCQTCHTFLPTSSGSVAASLRRQEDGSAGRAGFCGQCHSSDSRHTSAGMHWQAVDVAHVQAKYDDRGSKHDSLDDTTRRCLGCHDGISAGDNVNSISWGQNLGVNRGLQQDHPVGVRYPGHSSRGSERRFRSASSLPDAIRLPGGRVGCVSCHNMYAGEDQLLAITNDRSTLCFSCHDME